MATKQTEAQQVATTRTNVVLFLGADYQDGTILRSFQDPHAAHLFAAHVSLELAEAKSLATLIVQSA